MQKVVGAFINNLDLTIGTDVLTGHEVVWLQAQS